jgi:TRAP-type C4-dicarboxylate transport system permease small subunit
MVRLIDRIVGGLAYAMAMAGGLALLAVMLSTVASVAGRALIPLGLGPVPGDYELVQFGVAFAVCAFLPLCQWRRGHVTVDIALKPLGRRLNGWVDAAGCLLMTAGAGLLAWRTALGLRDKMGDGFYVETTFILRLPVWWGYAAALSGLAVFALVSAWSVVRAVREARG